MGKRIITYDIYMEKNGFEVPGGGGDCKGAGRGRDD